MPFLAANNVGPISPLLVLLLAPLAAIILILAKAPARRTAGFAAPSTSSYAIGLIWMYPAAQGGYQYVMDCRWVNMPGLPPIHFHLGVDGISLPLVFLTAIVTFAAVAISPGLRAALGRSITVYLLLMSLGAMGAFISLDLFFFYIFHEFALIPTFLLIGIWGSQNRQFASFQVTIYLMAGQPHPARGPVALVMALPRAAPHLRHPRAAGLHLRASAAARVAERHLPARARRLRHPRRPLPLPFLGAARLCLRAARRRDAARGHPEEVRALRHDPHRHPDAARRLRDVWQSLLLAAPGRQLPLRGLHHHRAKGTADHARLLQHHAHGLPLPRHRLLERHRRDRRGGAHGRARPVAPRCSSA